MKIRFVKNTSVDIIKVNLDEIWPKYFYKNDELLIERINYSKQSATLETVDGDIITDIPIEAFEEASVIHKNNQEYDLTFA